MKKLLSLLTISTLSTTVVSSTNSLINNVKVINKIDSNDLITKSDNPFVSNITDVKMIYSTEISPDGTIWVGAESGLYKSTDGKTFNKVTNNPDFVNVYSIIIVPDGTIWVGDARGLYKSTDNGVTFNKVMDSPYFVNAWKIASDGTIWASGGVGIYKSTDGKTLTEIKLVGTAPKTTLEIALNGFVYVSINGDGWDNSGLYKSTDGKTFNKVTSMSGKEWLQNNQNINAIKIAPDGTIWVGTNTSLYKSTDNGVTFNKVTDMKIYSLNIVADGTIWVGAGDGIYRTSNNGVTFNKVMEITVWATAIKIAPDGTIWVGTNSNNGLYKIDLIDNLLTLNQPDYIGNKFNGFVYKNEQKIDIKSNYLKSATLDGNALTIPSMNVPINVGDHTLILTLNNKDDCNQYLGLFGGNATTGQVTFNFLIKNSINPIKELNYKTTTSDTDLLTGLVSNMGNTNGNAIIQTRAKQGTGSHAATLNISLNSDMFNLEKSYYVSGIVDGSTNDFNVTGQEQKITKNLLINTDGTYHLHLLDIVGNTYDSYLELGQNNWKLQGTFNDQQLNELSAKLNVTVSLSDPDKKAEAMGWLQNYQSDADKSFNDSVALKGKGFNISINDLVDGYKKFLNPVTYIDTNTKEAINQNSLDKAISDLANKDLTDGLNKLPKDLNVDTSNVTNKSTLDSYSVWIGNYNDFINDNKKIWIDQVSAIASHGFASETEVQQIKDYLNSLNFSKYLKHVIWTPTTSLATSNDYKQFVELDKLQSDTIDWVNKTIPDINGNYQEAINNAETGLNLHGYSIDQLLNGKSKPQTKSEIDNFSDGQSYHNFLQSQANTTFKSYQLKMGLGIGIPLALFTLGVGIFLYWRFNKKNQPYSENINKD
ncbi:two-component regulator propeller domain-containing protein [Spiroplasma sp. AdecLV25b]|uniref:WD40/YVTN/BNR-like repeat-containing protein n=1 Tax=Spiroplasma sp. AdecLV25b TaxID=3027162 RepID=UPI0027E0A1CA|nr:two-component regulator propeller domain-containing protein [Spiroplasma sp. AdecLV25b]